MPIPDGYKEVLKGVFISQRGDVVVTGSPPEDEDDPECLLHNCDDMGCGWEHVLFRGTIEEACRMLGM